MGETNGQHTSFSNNHNIIVKFYNLEQTIEKIEFKFSENTCIKFKKSD
jgi:hypothetical protein